MLFIRCQVCTMCINERKQKRKWLSLRMSTWRALYVADDLNLYNRWYPWVEASSDMGAECIRLVPCSYLVIVALGLLKASRTCVVLGSCAYYSSHDVGKTKYWVHITTITSLSGFWCSLGGRMKTPSLVSKLIIKGRVNSCPWPTSWSNRLEDEEHSSLLLAWDYSHSVYVPHDVRVEFYTKVLEEKTMSGLIAIFQYLLFHVPWRSNTQWTPSRRSTVSSMSGTCEIIMRGDQSSVGSQKNYHGLLRQSAPLTVLSKRI